MKSCIRRSKGTIHKIILNQMATTELRTVQYLISRCAKLEYLEMSRGFISATITESLHLAKNLTTLLLNDKCEVTAYAVAYVLEKCPQLRSASFRNVGEGPSIILPSPDSNLQLLSLWCQHGTVGLQVIRCLSSILEMGGQLTLSSASHLRTSQTSASWT
jgi:hypothetical protein